MPIIIRKTIKPIRQLYFSIQSGSLRKLSSNFLSLKQRKNKDKFFMFFFSGSSSVILLLFFPAKILLKLKGRILINSHPLL